MVVLVITFTVASVVSELFVSSPGVASLFSLKDATQLLVLVMLELILSIVLSKCPSSVVSMVVQTITLSVASVINTLQLERPDLSSLLSHKDDTQLLVLRMLVL